MRKQIPPESQSSRYSTKKKNTNVARNGITRCGGLIAAHLPPRQTGSSGMRLLKNIHVRKISSATLQLLQCQRLKSALYFPSFSSRREPLPPSAARQPEVLQVANLTIPSHRSRRRSGKERSLLFSRVFRRFIFAVLTHCPRWRRVAVPAEELGRYASSGHGIDGPSKIDWSRAGRSSTGVVKERFLCRQEVTEDHNSYEENTRDLYSTGRLTTSSRCSATVVALRMSL